ncbi:MAG TPA: hypothetical protein VK962_07805 [Actinomycetota bacterium]|nr:hypothetical protein [Actinomycetota bacterium]
MGQAWLVPRTGRLERASAVLRRVLDAIDTLLRGLLVVAAVAACSVTAAWVAWVAAAPPQRADTWIGRFVLLALLLVPSGILAIFVLGVRELRELPRLASDLPADVKQRAVELGERTRRTSNQRRGVFGMIAAVARLGRVVLGSRDVLTPYAAISAALRPPLLLAALVSFGIAAVEIPVAVIALLIALLW